MLSVIQGASGLDFADCLLTGVIQHHVGSGIVLLPLVHMVALHETAALGWAGRKPKYLALSVFPEWLSASELKAQEHSSPAFWPPASTALSLFLLSGVLLGKGGINATHPSLPENTYLHGFSSQTCFSYSLTSFVWKYSLNKLFANKSSSQGVRWYLLWFQEADSGGGIWSWLACCLEGNKIPSLIALSFMVNQGKI